MKNEFESQLTAIGRVIKTVGYKGALIIESFNGYDAVCENLDKCLIRVNGIWAPFFVLEIKDHGADLEVLLEDIDEKTAKQLTFQEIYVMTKDLPELEEDEDDNELDGWLGFTIIDDHWGIIGVIEELKILPGQELAVVTYKEKNIHSPGRRSDLRSRSGDSNDQDESAGRLAGLIKNVPPYE